MRSVLQADVPLLASKEYAGPYVKLDQGFEGACVGFSIANDLLGSPVRVRPPGYDAAKSKLTVANQFAQKLYEAARRMDEWAGENYDGTSVRAGMKAARAAGYIGEFRWILTASELQRTLDQEGPVIIGVNWYENQYDLTPGPDFTVRSGGALVGGHALCVNGRYRSRRGRRQYRTRQSWGGDYGAGGDVWWDADHLEHLIFEDDGEAAIALTRSYGPDA